MKHRLKVIYLIRLVWFHAKKQRSKGAELLAVSHSLYMDQHNAIKDPHWYAVQGSDTTKMLVAASLPGQKKPDMNQTYI